MTKTSTWSVLSLKFDWVKVSAFVLIWIFGKGFLDAEMRKLIFSLFRKTPFGFKKDLIDFRPASNSSQDSILNNGGEKQTYFHLFVKLCIYICAYTVSTMSSHCIIQRGRLHIFFTINLLSSFGLSAGQSCAYALCLSIHKWFFIASFIYPCLNVLWLSPLAS